jgi:hypothetical protein
MESPHGLWLWAFAALAFALPSVVAADQPEHAIPLSDLRSGKEFVSCDTRALQDDLTSNPGMLWVASMGSLFPAPAVPGPALPIPARNYDCALDQANRVRARLGHTMFTAFDSDELRPKPPRMRWKVHRRLERR